MNGLNEVLNPALRAIKPRQENYKSKLRDRGRDALFTPEDLE